MIVAALGSKNFSNYDIFMRGMRTALTQKPEDDKEVILYAAGMLRLNVMAQEFSNKSEDGFRGRGMKISCRKRPYTWLEENMKDVNYFMFFKLPGESNSPMIELADKLGVEAAIYAYE
jgi:ribonuclease HI